MIRWHLCVSILFLGVISGVNAYAAIYTESIDYKDGDTVLEGCVAYDENSKGVSPAVLIVHEWTGLGPYVKRRAIQIAELGYVAFAVDVYGKGVRPKDTKEAAREAGIYRADRQLMRRRLQAALARVKEFPFVDETRIAAIGYCFGGGAALELARSGADIAGVVSFHGNLDTPHPEDAGNIRGKILVCHGADDPVVPKAQVDVFQDEMRAARVDWQMDIYGGAVHSFTNPDSGDDPSKGVAYNKKADERSWEAMKIFLREIFRQGR